jgi:hypothetical protein
MTIVGSSSVNIAVIYIFERWRKWGRRRLKWKEFRIQHNVVVIATRHGLDSPGLESRLGGGGNTIPLLHFRSDRPWGPPSLLYHGYRCSFPRVKRPGRGVGHSPVSSAELKNEWSCTANPKLCLEWQDMGWLLALKEFTLQIFKNWIPHRRPTGYCHVRKCLLLIMRILWRRQIHFK